MSESQNYSKEIVITNLSSKEIIPKPGQTFTAFVVYQITGNDGIVYETPNGLYYAKRKVGEKVKVDYYVENRKGSNGRIYSSYKLIVPVAPIGAAKQDNSLMIEGMTKIFRRIEEMEEKVLARLSLTPVKIQEEEKVIIPFSDEPTTDELNGELQAIYNEGDPSNGITSEELNEVLPPDKLPF